MNLDIKYLPESLELSHEMLISLHQSFSEIELKLTEKEAELHSLKSKYENLLEQLRLAKQARFAPKSEKNTLQMNLFDEAGIQANVEEISEEIVVQSHTRKKHPIRKALPQELPREVIVHDISDDEKVCSCGCALVKIGEEITEQLKYIPPEVSVLQHVRLKYACKPCQDNVKIAPMPVLLLPKSIATPELVAQTIIAKYSDHVPLYRQEKIWTRYHIDLPRSSLCAWLLKTALLCEPLIGLLRKNMIACDYLQADETPVQVMHEPARLNTSKSYMWCYRGGGSIIYDYQETREGTHAKEFLSGFKGYLQTDAYAGYHKVSDVISVGCHAHARRSFAELAKMTQTPGLSHQALAFYRKLYAIEDTARKNNLSSDQRFTLRLKEAKPILETFKVWLDQHLTQTSEQSKIGKAIRYALSNWIKLNNYLKDGRIEIDNNLIENAIRPFALGRKNWLFMGSPLGAKAGAIFYSLIETCKANKVEPYKYFCTMLHKIRLCESEQDYQELLPQHIKFI